MIESPHRHGRVPQPRWWFGEVTLALRQMKEICEARGVPPRRWQWPAAEITATTLLLVPLLLISVVSHLQSHWEVAPLLGSFALALAWASSRLAWRLHSRSHLIVGIGAAMVALGHLLAYLRFLYLHPDGRFLDGALGAGWCLLVSGLVTLPYSPLYVAHIDPVRERPNRLSFVRSSIAALWVLELAYIGLRASLSGSAWPIPAWFVWGIATGCLLGIAAVFGRTIASRARAAQIGTNWAARTITAGVPRAIVIIAVIGILVALQTKLFTAMSVASSLRAILVCVTGLSYLAGFGALYLIATGISLVLIQDILWRG